MKSPLLERPIFHHLEKRTQTHIFLCVLAYHLLVAIEKHFLDRGVHTSWWTLREQLRTHQVVTVVLPTKEGQVLKIRKGSTPEPTRARSLKGMAIWRRFSRSALIGGLGRLADPARAGLVYGMAALT